MGNPPTGILIEAQLAAERAMGAVRALDPEEMEGQFADYRENRDQTEERFLARFATEVATSITGVADAASRQIELSESLAQAIGAIRHQVEGSVDAAAGRFFGVPGSCRAAF